MLYDVRILKPRKDGTLIRKKTITAKVLIKDYWDKFRKEGAVVNTEKAKNGNRRMPLNVYSKLLNDLVCKVCKKKFQHVQKQTVGCSKECRRVWHLWRINKSDANSKKLRERTKAGKKVDLPKSPRLNPNKRKEVPPWL